jgi:acyl-CoA thioester hydrolase
MNEEAFREHYSVVIELPVQWGDMDALQHVNNAVYLRWFESARIEFFDRVGFFDRMKSDSIGPILASSTVRYRAPIEYPDNVLVGVNAKEVSGSGLTHDYGVFSLGKQVLATTGEARLVMYNFTEKQKADIPEDVLTRIRMVSKEPT